MRYMSSQTGLEDKTAAWNGIIKTINKGLASKTTTTLTHFDIDRLMSDTEGSDDVMLFTCGHHFTKHTFDTKIVPSFESRILGKLPISGAVMLNRYQSGHLKSLACPQCVYGSVRALVG